jgi:hypothetical protein
MSPRAAWRLEELGFMGVYDFVGGKTEWIERGLPTDGTGPFLFLAGQILRPATATCGPDTLAGTVRRELPPDPDSVCAVTNDQGVVLGRVRRKDLPEDDGVRVETFMQLGPATVQPREELPALLDRMRRAEVKTILVTTSRGQLLGVVNRDEGDQFLRDRSGRTPFTSRQRNSVTDVDVTGLDESALVCEDDHLSSITQAERRRRRRRARRELPDE